MEVLFQKTAPVLIKKCDREESNVSIGITILSNTINNPVHKKELIVRLTNENDPFFLFSLNLSEDDYQQLKLQQGLLIDFPSFPQKLINLLELCLTEVNQESPKFILQFKVDSNSHHGAGASLLDIVETNPFRHLIHLSLQLLPATDVHLKKYLAECLLSLKDKVSDLTQKLKVTQTDLTSQLMRSEEALSHCTKELEKLKSDWSAHTSSLTNENAALLTSAKEKAIQELLELQEKYVKEKKELESSYNVQIKSLEGLLKERDTTIKELTDNKYRSESIIRELRAKLKGTEEELDGIRQEIQTVRKDNSSLDAQHHQMTKTLNQLETKAAVLEQEVKNKDLMIDKTNKLLELEREQKSSVSLQLEQQNRQVTKLDTAYRQLTQEVKKGNEIIAKLQGEVKDLKSKLKVRNMVTMKQEEVINEKGKEIDTYRNEVKTLSETVRAKDGDVDKLKREIGTLQETCEQQKETLKNNENIISWLNKQINEQGVPKVGGALPHPQDALSSIRPYTSGLYQPRFSSTPAGRGANNEGRHVLGPLQNYPQKVLFHGPVKHQSGAVPSPLVASELTSPSFNPMVIKTSPPNIPQLDRYLPPLTGTGTAIGTTIPTSCTSIPTSGTSIPTAIPTKVSPQAPSGTNTLLTPPFSKPLPLNKHVRSN